MDLCSSGHQEVCYEGKRCPACELLDEKSKLETAIDEQKEVIRQLEAND